MESSGSPGKSTARIPKIARGAPARSPEPVGYLTSESLAALWDERRQDVDRHRQAHPEDLKGIELRQRVASQLLQTFRLLADLEQQLGVVLGLPVLDLQHPTLLNGDAPPLEHG